MFAWIFLCVLVMIDSRCVSVRFSNESCYRRKHLERGHLWGLCWNKLWSWISLNSTLNFLCTNQFFIVFWQGLKPLPLMLPLFLLLPLPFPLSLPLPLPSPWLSLLPLRLPSPLLLLLSLPLPLALPLPLPLTLRGPYPFAALCFQALLPVFIFQI